MKRFFKLSLPILLILGVFLYAGCGNKPAVEEKKTESQKQSLGGLTKENPIKVNKADGTVTFLAEVNGKYFYEATRHGAAFKDGSNGEKAIFRGMVNTEPFYNGLIELGAKAGNNMTMDNKEKTNVAGDPLDVSVTWDGASKEYKLAEIVKDSNAKPFDVRFGGNITASLDKKTGCLICLDSCPVGITSNATYTYGAVEKRKEVGFTSNKDVLPADGTLVAVKLTFKK